MTAVQSVPTVPESRTAKGGRGARILKGLRRALPANTKARVGLGIIAAYVLVAAVGPWVVQSLMGLSPTDLTPDVLQPPSLAHPLGTTQDGSDVFAQLVVGTRTSLLVGAVAAIISTVLSVAIGLIGGYYGGTVDSVLGAITNAFLVLPGLPLVIVLAGYLQGRGGPYTVALVIGLTGWAWGARSKRVQTLSLRSRDFVLNARLLGESNRRIMAVEVLPNLLPVISATLMMSLVTSILAVSGLEFLGIGDINTTSWGQMLYLAQQRQALMSGAWWWFVPPGVAITVLGAAAGLVNFGIDELTNPRLRGARKQTRRAAEKSRTAGKAAQS
ncbi:ABC transporter permease [Streptomyces pathocidini]|uniref:ABC transporter permease n=1 Tax=Streptomyces pathocidini TaxID=1650571 RepID=A0ABW7UXQ6_9ACTN|nr:ABC transporter permease [Streptomyces pathocidini]